MKKTEQIKAYEYRKIALMALSVPQYRALPWEVSKELKSLAQDIELEIDIAIGKELDALAERAKTRAEELISPFRNEQGNVSEESKVQLNRLLSSDETMLSINQQEKALWEKELSFKRPEIYFPDKDYNTEFSKEKVSVTFLKGVFEVDGFDAFLDLCVMGILKKTE